MKVRKAIGIGFHLLLFLAAALIFTFGLGVGLSINTTLGTLLWCVSGAIVVLNLVWIIRRPLWR